MNQNRIKDRCHRIRFAGLDPEDHTLHLLDDALDEQDRLFVYDPPRREISSLPRVEQPNYADFLMLLAAVGVVGLIGVLAWVCFSWRW